jgi:lipid-binding SYLF domain-containing protein
MPKRIALIMALTVAALPLAAQQSTQKPAQQPAQQSAQSAQQSQPPQPSPEEKHIREQDRVQNAGRVFGEIVGGPHVGLQYALDRAECVIVLPGTIKASGNVFTLFWGGSFGRGVMTCRSGPNFDGPWGAPTMVALEGASWGLEGGAESVDILITIMNPDGANSILTSKFKLGGNASAAIGDVGRDSAAEEDLVLHAEMLTFARAKGAFAGAALTGTTLRADGPANRKLYGHHVNAKDVVLHGAEAPPDCAKLLLDTLNKQSPKRVINANAAQNPSAK